MEHGACEPENPRTGYRELRTGNRDCDRYYGVAPGETGTIMTMVLKREGSAPRFGFR